jgi:hypothetical protein
MVNTVLRGDQLAHAAYGAGRGKPIAEVAATVKAHPDIVRHTLHQYNIKFDDMAYGYRALRVRVAPKHRARLQVAAEARGYLGEGGAERVLEDLVRAVMSHQTTLDAVLDDGFTTPEIGPANRTEKTNDQPKI